MKRIGGSRRKTRSLFKSKGPKRITAMLQSFGQGDRVALVASPSYHKGMPFRRFYGKVATVLGKRGSCYEVAFNDKGKQKTSLLHPVHLKKVRI